MTVEVTNTFARGTLCDNVNRSETQITLKVPTTPEEISLVSSVFSVNKTPCGRPPNNLTNGGMDPLPPPAAPRPRKLSALLARRWTNSLMTNTIVES